MKILLKSRTQPCHGDVNINCSPFPIGRFEKPFSTGNVEHLNHLSRHHATIFEKAGVFYVIDRNSTNGTFVNAERIGKEPSKLLEDDIITFGHTSFSYTVSTKTKTIQELPGSLITVGSISVPSIINTKLVIATVVLFSCALQAKNFYLHRATSAPVVSSGPPIGNPNPAVINPPGPTAAESGGSRVERMVAPDHNGYSVRHRREPEIGVSEERFPAKGGKHTIIPHNPENQDTQHGWGAVTTNGNSVKLAQNAGGNEVVSHAPAVNGPGSKNGNKYDIDAPPKTRNQLTRSLYYGGAVEVKTEYEGNYNLDNDDDADIWKIEPQLKLAFTYKPTQKIHGYIDFNLKRKSTLIDRQNNENTKTSLTIKRAYVRFDEILDDLSLKLGRQRFKDKREWFYDEELDGARLFYRNRGLRLEASVSRENVFDNDLLNSSNNDEINNYFLSGRFKLHDKTRMSVYYLVRDDRSRNGGRPVFLGTQITGKYADKTAYWLTAAYVFGKDELDRKDDRREDISAYGFDLGGTHVIDTVLSPSVTLAYARGSGDSNPDNNTDRNFRQTDLQDNNSRFNGVTSFKYYGELMDPELSNLSIWYGGIGIRPTRKTSIDLVYHQYRQVEASEDIRDSNIDLDPSGLNRDLGRELDLVIGYREIKNLFIELDAAYFWPGDAFPNDADGAFHASMQVRYSF